jgi:hypothetical protein
MLWQLKFGLVKFRGQFCISVMFLTVGEMESQNWDTTNG